MHVVIVGQKWLAAAVLQACHTKHYTVSAVATGGDDASAARLTPPECCTARLSPRSPLAI